MDRRSKVGLLAALLFLPACQQCLEFGCGEGGFVWRGRASEGLPAGRYSVQLTTPSGAYGFGCEVPGTPPPSGSPVDCVAASVPSGGDETATLQVSFGIEGTEAELLARISSPNDDPDQEGDRGPDEVTVRVEFDGATLFEETYQPEYGEQSRGRGCGSCLHEASEVATL